MTMSYVRTSLLVAAAGTLAAGSLALAAPALAADSTITGGNIKTIHNVDQGATVDTFWTYRNDGPGLTPLTGGTITFHSPTGASFDVSDGQSLSSSFSTNGVTYINNNLVARNCLVGSDGTQLSCSLALGLGPTSAWLTGNYFRYALPLIANTDAASGPYSGAVEVTFKDNAGNTYTVNDGTTDVNIHPAASTPIISPAIAATTVVLGVTALVGASTLPLIRSRK